MDCGGRAPTMDTLGPSGVAWVGPGGSAPKMDTLGLSGVGCVGCGGWAPKMDTLGRSGVSWMRMNNMKASSRNRQRHA